MAAAYPIAAILKLLLLNLSNLPAGLRTPFGE